MEELKREFKEHIIASMNEYSKKWKDYFSPEINAILEDANINLEDSYYVRGTRAYLKFFETYYNFKKVINLNQDSIHKMPLMTYIENFRSGSTKPLMDDYSFNGVLVLEEGEEASFETDKFENWITSVVKKEVEDRMLSGNVTLILSARKIKGVAGACKDNEVVPSFKFVNLYKLFKGSSIDRGNYKKEYYNDEHVASATSTTVF